MSTDYYQNFILPYAAIIIKICRVYTNEQADFEDYYQEVCLQIWRSRNNFKGEAQWSTWVYRISLNTCLTLSEKDRKRKQKVTLFESYNAVSDDEMTIFKDNALTKLYRAIKKLTELDRAIILLYLEEKKYVEIAEIIGSNANNIGVRINRIKTRLNQIITKDHD